MIDNVRVTYGFSIGCVSYKELIHKVSTIASSYHVDFDLRITKNSVTAEVYPYKFRNAQQISEKEGAQILSSLVIVFENYIEDGVLWSVEMASALPF